MGTTIEYIHEQCQKYATNNLPYFCVDLSDYEECVKIVLVKELTLLFPLIFSFDANIKGISVPKAQIEKFSVLQRLEIINAKNNQHDNNNLLTNKFNIVQNEILNDKYQYSNMVTILGVSPLKLFSYIDKSKNKKDEDYYEFTPNDKMYRNTNCYVVSLTQSFISEMVSDAVKYTARFSNKLWAIYNDINYIRIMEYW